MDEHLEDRVAQLLADAEEARAAGNHATARAFAHAALALRPGDPVARSFVELIAGEDDGERRQLTVMFCDVVGSTALSQRTDPEIVRSVLRGYRGVLDRVVTEVEGNIALWIGDGALVYFGYPRPHEDDAWRAVHAGVALLEGLAPVAEAALAEHGIELAVRVAVHTGLVVRAEMGTPNAPDRDAILGSTPNMAARLQDKARPGTMVISGATYALVSRRVAVEPVGPFELKGIDGVVGAFEVVAEVPEPPAIERLADGSTYIGRVAEVADLRGRWDAVERGESRAVAIQGDPGIGKTRLTAELRRRVVERGARTLLSSCSTFHRATPLFPVRRVVEAAAEISPDSTPVEVVERLRTSLAALGHEDAVPVVADLLGVADAAGLAPMDLDPQRRREVTLTALLDWLVAEAGRAPLLLVVDDLQWADPTTADLVDRIVSRRAPGLMLVMTVRAGHPIPWSRTNVPVLLLEPLDEAEMRVLIAELAGPQADDDLVASVLSRADGVPLFVEELVNSAVVPQDTSHIDLPASLRDPLLSRLAAAGDDLGLAQLVATIGDDVDVPLLAAVTGRPDSDLQASLKALAALGLLDGDDVLGTYRFHHHLMAELAYETQLRSTRQARHASIADAIVDGGLGRSRASLGRHQELAGRPAEAIRAYVEAAQAAQHRGSHPEAITTLDHAMELLPSITDEDERNALELLTLEGRGFTATSVLGYGAPQASVDYARCLELIRATPAAQLEPRSVMNAYWFFAIHGDLDVADELSTTYIHTELRRRAWAPTSTRVLLRFLRGDLLGSIADSRALIESDDGRLDQPIPDDYPVPNEPVSSSLGVLAACLALVGDVAGAESAIDQLHQRVAHLPFPYGPQSMGTGLNMAAIGWWNLRDETRLRTTVEEIRAVSQRHGIVSYEVLSAMLDALWNCRFGEPGASGHAAMMVELCKATGALVWVPAFGAAVAEAQLREGNPAGALETAEANLTFGADLGVHLVDAPLLMVRAEAKLATGDPAGLDDLIVAADTAGAQGATLFELQARLASSRHDPSPVTRAALATVVERLPADRSFVDLDAARALLGIGP